MRHRYLAPVSARLNNAPPSRAFPKVKSEANNTHKEAELVLQPTTDLIGAQTAQNRLYLPGEAHHFLAMPSKLSYTPAISRFTVESDVPRVSPLLGKGLLFGPLFSPMGGRSTERAR